MTRICQDIAVPLPAAETERGIAEYFERRKRGDGTATIPLRVNLHDFGLPDNLALVRNVEVRVAKRRDEQNLNEELAISWTPMDKGPYPSFDGLLIVWSNGGAHESFIELSGEYQPPGGTAGAIFDEMIGHLIAERTAHEFLAALRDGILSAKETPHAYNG